MCFICIGYHCVLVIFRQSDTDSPQNTLHDYIFFLSLVGVSRFICWFVVVVPVLLSRFEPCRGSTLGQVCFICIGYHRVSSESSGKAEKWSNCEIGINYCMNEGMNGGGGGR